MAGSVNSEDGDLGFQIAPMVDVVFVLMLFFMASAGSLSLEKELNLNLPANAQGVDVAIMIDIASDGAVSVNNQRFTQPGDRSLTALRDWLATAREAFGDNDPVIIRPADDVRHERIVDVLNAASAAKVRKLSFS